MAAGCTAYDLGVAPTPAVAYVVRESGAVGGIVISASHNPWEYNGIKFFSTTGAKLSPEDEERIEELVSRSRRGDLRGASPGDVGVLEQVAGELEAYRESLVELMQRDLGNARPLEGLRVCLDCANGAATVTAPDVFRALGAEVIAVGTEPDGENINDGCGSLHPEVVAGRVAGGEADLGFSFDGDADRVIAVAEDGTVVDGDRIMLVCARDLKRRGLLQNDTLVATVMSNMVLDLLCNRSGITVARAPVGDREVYRVMGELGAVLGGEQSGHIIFSDHNQTGDGLLTALQLVGARVRSGRSLKSLVGDFEPLPQVLVNVETTDKQGALASPGVAQAISEVEDRLDGRGRVLVRPSGTEPVIRVMVEGPEAGELDELAGKVAQAIREFEGQGR